LGRVLLIDLLVLAALGGLSAFFLSRHWGNTPFEVAQGKVAPAVTTTTTTLPPTTTTTTLPPPGPGFVAGHVTAVGDSVMLDYQDPLQMDIPGINVNASVSRQWSDGLQVLQLLKASGQLGAEVIVGLGTNGPITEGDFDAIMQVLSGASRVVFVNFHVDRPWQDPNNAVLANGASRYPNVFVADWATLAAQNPQWFGGDGTHLGIDGPGAIALAMLVASTLANG
jgi:lysophospholipase L1-like esterase